VGAGKGECPMKALITGGAGFIGSNVAARLIKQGHTVAVMDNLSRPGADKNLEWLTNQGQFDFLIGDLRNTDQVQRAIQSFSSVDMVLHLGAQVAVTTSVEDPRADLETNLIGTFNLLEAIRQAGIRPFVAFASTNKVYGKMDDLAVVDKGGRYEYQDVDGIDETRPLDFYSPYGCSKGAADQYLHDYARMYDLPTCVFRMSCIYGPRQFGIEDQGWVAWFIIAAVLGKPITIYGDGKQVRDILHVDDLIDLYEAAFTQQDVSAGNIFNAGGGKANTISLLELLEHLEKRLDKKIPVTNDDWRQGDQKVYISDTSKAKSVLGWEPKIDKMKGIDALVDWVLANKTLFE
jgi:CDP-paratose 2-epimerase